MRYSSWIALLALSSPALADTAPPARKDAPPPAKRRDPDPVEQPSTKRPGPLTREELAIARQLYESATRHYNLGEFAEPAREYREAYRLRADPAFLFNLAQAQRLGGDARGALFSYRAYLRSAPAPRGREQIERFIAELEGALAKAPPAP